MRAMVQLPGYLERVLAGGRDLALVLLPLLNDLRAVRGSALLSEGTLLLLNLKSDRQAQPTSPAPGEAPLSPAQWARRLRSRFQTGTGRLDPRRAARAEPRDPRHGRDAARAGRHAAMRVPVVVGRRRAARSAARARRREQRLGQAPARPRRPRDQAAVRNQGEVRYAQTPPVELLNNLLYYVARSTTAGPRVAAVRASFRLNELLPVDESIEQERENLSAPSVKLMHTVAAAIREDLTRVKDVLDIFVRRGGGQVEELAPQIEMLHKIGDTLGVLGLGELRARVQEANARLRGRRRGPRKSPTKRRWCRSLRRLIKVEDHLDERAGRPDPAEGRAPTQGRRRSGRRGRRFHRPGFPAGAGRRAARVRRQSGARQGKHRAECQRHARCGRLRQLAGADARHQGRAADARQDAAPSRSSMRSRRSSSA